ncbi:MAG: hypothetical protein ACQERR_08585 [Pseudomonadota bacterium]
MRLWQQGLFMASRWAWRVAKEGVVLPVPRSVLERLAAKLDDPTVENLVIEPRPQGRLRVAGRKKVGVWLDFEIVFELAAPGSGDPPRALILVPESVSPFPARGPMLAAMEALTGVERQGDRILLNLDTLMTGHEWGRKVPAMVRERVRVADVTTEEGRIRMKLRLSSSARGPGPPERAGS